jgi:two-component system phosphate regulon response regulator PhoB
MTGADVQPAILVVDDQPELRLLVRLTLQPLGKIATAASAEEALEHIRRVPTRLLLLDVWLGAGQSGLAFCRQLKDDPATRAIKVILLSANGNQPDIDAGMAAGADAYIVKPYSPRDLLVKATQLLQAL